MLKNIIKSSVVFSLFLVLLTSCNGKCNPKGVSYQASMPVEEIKIIEEIKIEEIIKPAPKHVHKKAVKHKNKVTKHKMKKKHPAKKAKHVKTEINVSTLQMVE